MNCYDEEYPDLTAYEEQLLEKVYDLEQKVHALERKNAELELVIYRLIPEVEGD